VVVRYCADHAPMAMTGEIREMQGRAYLPNTYMSRECLQTRTLFLCVIFVFWYNVYFILKKR